MHIRNKGSVFLLNTKLHHFICYSSDSILLANSSLLVRITKWLLWLWSSAKAYMYSIDTPALLNSSIAMAIAPGLLGLFR